MVSYRTSGTITLLGWYTPEIFLKSVIPSLATPVLPLKYYFVLTKYDSEQILIFLAVCGSLFRGNLLAVVCTALIIAANDALKGSRRRQAVQQQKQR